ncbi:MAG: hypothetical protein JWN48_1882 [Myxococcaceae bacterium]|nr:hypothetical protein [Myxococcaceae bacterium]
MLLHDDVIADPLVLGVVRGDRAAWVQLTILLETWVEDEVPRHWRMRKARLTGSEDDVRDVLLGVLERIDRDDFRALRQYLDRKLEEVPDVRAMVKQAPTFHGWLSGLLDFVIRDHVRHRYGRKRGGRISVGTEDRVPSKRNMQSWAVHPQEGVHVFGAVRPELSRMMTARSIMSYAADTFGPRELSVFRRYLEQASFDELAEEFTLRDGQAARAEIRRLKERLRARFAERQ